MDHVLNTDGTKSSKEGSKFYLVSHEVSERPRHRGILSVREPSEQKREMIPSQRSLGSIVLDNLFVAGFSSSKKSGLASYRRKWGARDESRGHNRVFGENGSSTSLRIHLEYLL